MIVRNRQSCCSFNNSVLTKGLLQLFKSISFLMYLSFRQNLLKDWQIMTKIIYSVRESIILNLLQVRRL